MECGIFGLERTVYLIGRNMVETMLRVCGAVDPERLGHLEQHMRTDDVGADEIIGPEDGTVDMRFCGEMHQRIDVVLFARRSHGAFVANVAAHKYVTGITLESREILELAGVGQGIEHDHFPRLGARQPVPYEIRSDETGAAGDQYIMRFEAHPTSSLDCAANAAQESSPWRGWIPC